jgi:hypothetical protein
LWANIYQKEEKYGMERGFFQLIWATLPFLLSFPVLHVFQALS